MKLNLWYLYWAWILAILLGLVAAWRRNNEGKICLRVLLVSALVLVAATSHKVRWVVLGADYSSRLYVAIGLNMLLTCACGLYLAFTRRFMGGVAGVMLALTWFWVGAVNSVV